MYDNTPDESTEGYGAFANHGDLAKNSPGGGNVPKDHDSRPRVRNQPVATFENLMKEYKSFIGESDNTDPDVEEDAVFTVLSLLAMSSRAEFVFPMYACIT
jgi:hypothetical protein